MPQCSIPLDVNTTSTRHQSHAYEYDLDVIPDRTQRELSTTFMRIAQAREFINLWRWTVTCTLLATSQDLKMSPCGQGRIFWLFIRGMLEESLACSDRSARLCSTFLQFHVHRLPLDLSVFPSFSWQRRVDDPRPHVAPVRHSTFKIQSFVSYTLPTIFVNNCLIRYTSAAAMACAYPPPRLSSRS
jgi:hypothetical protein